MFFYMFYAISTTIIMIQLESFHYLEKNEEDTFFLSDPGTLHFFSVWLSVGFITLITCVYEVYVWDNIWEHHVTFAREYALHVFACLSLFLVFDLLLVVKKLKFAVDFWLRPGTCHL